MWLPRPYPDELVGSLLTRGCRLYGVSWTRLLGVVTGTWPRPASFSLPVAAAEVAHWCGCSAEMLLDHHTLFSYVIALTSVEHRAQIRSQVLTRSADRRNLTGILQPVRGAPSFRRLCLHCVKDDVAAVGEAYWHRLHHLPGVEWCLIHHVPLRSTTVRFQSTAGDHHLLMPTDVDSTRIESPLRPRIQVRLALHSSTLLTRSASDLGSLQDFRAVARNLGYEVWDGGLSGAAIARDLRDFFGPARLEEWACPVDSRARVPWPAHFVRPNSPTAQSPLKWVLMRTFLEFAPPVGRLKMSQYAPGGKRPPDCAALDRRCAAAMLKYLADGRRASRRITVRELLAASGYGSTFRRHRARFTLTREVLRRFRLSPQAAKRLDIVNGASAARRNAARKAKRDGAAV